MSFFAELRRRNVVKVGIAYVVASWLLLQLTEVLTELLEIGPEVGKIVIVLLIVGFVPALIFAWAFEMTPEGIKREHEVERSQSIAPKTGRKLDFVIIGMLVLIAGYFIWESRFKKGSEPFSQADTKKGSEPFSQADTEQIAESDGEKRALTPVVADKKSIAVLPFVNMSNDPDQEFFSDGLSEEILNALVKISDLRVISRTSAFAFKGKEMSIPQIAEQLGVSHVLEGSVRKAGNDVRITAQLIEVDTDSHLWSEAYSRTLDNVFDIQEEISTAIAGQLQLHLVSDASASRATENVEAYQLYLRGRHHYQARGLEDMRIAHGLLQQATDLDPDFDEAWANLAAAMTIEAYYVNQGHEALAQSAIAAASRAIEINPENGFAHAVLGLHSYADLNYEEALALYDRAIELQPNESNSYLWRAITLSALGYIDEAIATLKRAEEFDPVFTNLHNWMVSLYLMSGDTDAARRHRDLTLALDPDYTFNEAGGLELGDGDMAAVEAALTKVAHEYPNGEAINRAFIAALKDPSRNEEVIALFAATDGSSWSTPEFSFLYRLGEVEAATASWHELASRGRGLRASNLINYVWRAYDRKQLGHPATHQFFEDTGLVDYWRKHGDPDFCRVMDSGVECDTE
jgi:TolB-like protein